MKNEKKQQRSRPPRTRVYSRGEEIMKNQMDPHLCEGMEGIPPVHPYRLEAEKWIGYPITLECRGCLGIHVVEIKFPLVMKCVCNVVTLYFFEAVNALRTWTTLYSTPLHALSLRPGWPEVREASLFFSRVLAVCHPEDDSSFAITVCKGKAVHIDILALHVSTPVNHEMMRYQRWNR